MRRVWASLFALVCFTAGCASDSATGPDGGSPSYDNIAGTYAGPLSGVSQGIAMNATISLTFVQDDGSLSGSYAITGTLNDGQSAVDVSGTGAITGTIQSGHNPSVVITTASGECPNNRSTFSGAYDSDNRRLTATGQVAITDQNCSVVLTYPTTFILTK